MAGKFISTKYYDTQDSLVKMNQDLVKNPFYLYNDKKGTKVKYYNINTEKTTLDPGSKLAYTDIGDNSPIRFNVIHDLYLYQFIKMELNFDNGEFGLENNPLRFWVYVLIAVVSITILVLILNNFSDNKRQLFRLTTIFVMVISLISSIFIPRLLICLTSSRFIWSKIDIGMALTILRYSSSFLLKCIIKISTKPSTSLWSELTFSASKTQNGASQHYITSQINSKLYAFLIIP